MIETLLLQLELVVALIEEGQLVVLGEMTLNIEKVSYVMFLQAGQTLRTIERKKQRVVGRKSMNCVPGA